MLCNICHKTCERSLSYVCKCGHLGNKHVGFGVKPSPPSSPQSRETPSPPSRGQRESSPLSLRRAPSKPLLRPFVGLSQPKADEPVGVAPMLVVSNSDIASIANNMKIAAEKRKQAEEKASQERKAAAEKRATEEQKLAREQLEQQRIEQERIKREKEQEQLKAQEQRNAKIAREKVEQEKLKAAKLNEGKIVLEKAPKEENVSWKIAQDNSVTEQPMDLLQIQQKLASLVTTQKQIEGNYQAIVARHAERVKMAVTMTCKVCHKDCERGSVFICGCGHSGKQHERFGRAQMQPAQPTEEKEEIAKYVSQLENLKSEISLLTTKKDVEQTRMDAERLMQAKAEKIRQEAEVSAAKKAAKKALIEQEKAEKLAIEKARLDQLAAAKAEREAKDALLRAAREEIVLFMQSARSAQWSDGHWYAAQAESQVEGSDRFVVLFPEYDERAELPRHQIKSIGFVEAEAQELAEMALKQTAADEEEQKQAALVKAESDRVERMRKEEEEKGKQKEEQTRREEEEKRKKKEEAERLIKQQEEREKKAKEERERLQKEEEARQKEEQENRAKEERERLQKEEQEWLLRKEEEERLIKQQQEEQENKAKEERERLLQKEEEERLQKEEEERRLLKMKHDQEIERLIKQQKEEEEKREKEAQRKAEEDRCAKQLQDEQERQLQERMANEQQERQLQERMANEQQKRQLQERMANEQQERQLQERMAKEQIEREKEQARQDEEAARMKQQQEEAEVQKEQDRQKANEIERQTKLELESKEQREQREELLQKAKGKCGEGQQQLSEQEREHKERELEEEEEEEPVLEESLLPTEQTNVHMLQAEQKQEQEFLQQQKNGQDRGSVSFQDSDQGQTEEAVHGHEPRVLAGSEYETADKNQQISNNESDASLSSEQSDNNQQQSQQALQLEGEHEQESTKFTSNSVQSFGSADGVSTFHRETVPLSIESSTQDRQDLPLLHAHATSPESPSVGVCEPESKEEIVLKKETPSRSQSSGESQPSSTLFVNTSDQASVSAPSSPFINATDVDNFVDDDEDLDEYDEVDQFCANAKCAQWTDGHWYAAKVERETAERGMFHVVFTEYGDRAILHRSCIQCVDALEAEAEYLQRMAKQTQTTPSVVAATTPSVVAATPTAAAPIIATSPAIVTATSPATAPVTATSPAIATATSPATTPVTATSPAAATTSAVPMAQIPSSAKPLFQVGAGAPPVPPKPAFLVRPSVDFSAPPIPRLPSSPSLTSIVSPPPVPAKPAFLRESTNTPKNAPPVPPRDTPRSAPLVPPKDTPKAQDNEREKQRVTAEALANSEKLQAAKSPINERVQPGFERSSFERGSFQRIASERASFEKTADPEQTLKDLIANVQSALWTDGHWYTARVTHQDPTTELFHVLYTEFDGDSADLPRSQISTLTPQAAEHASKHKSNSSSMTSEVLIPLANTQEEKIVSTLVIGQRFIKHDSREKPQTMKIYCSPDLLSVRWETISGGTFSRPKKLSLQPAKTSSLRVLDVTDIRKGATTPTFIQSVKNKHTVREELSFSIIQKDNVSLDLEAETSELRDLWVQYLDWAKRRGEALTVH